MSAPITDAHLALVRNMAAQGQYLSRSILRYAQEIADSEAAAVQTAMLREYGNLSATNESLAKERDELRGALALGQQNCDDAYDDLRAERDAARAEVERLRHLEALLNQAAAEVTDHTFTAGGIAGLRAEVERLTECNRISTQSSIALAKQRDQLRARCDQLITSSELIDLAFLEQSARAERAEAEVERLKAALAKSCDDEREMSVSEGLPHGVCGLAEELTTRAERAEAFLRTLGKWEEGK
jgi:hypothetical protein